MKIASIWHTENESLGYCGIVTSFELNMDEYTPLNIQNVGGEVLYTPIYGLEPFNDSMSGDIVVKHVFFGERFVLPERKELAQELLKFK